MCVVCGDSTGVISGFIMFTPIFVSVMIIRVFLVSQVLLILTESSLILQTQCVFVVYVCVTPAVCVCVCVCVSVCVSCVRVRVRVCVCVI